MSDSVEYLREQAERCVRLAKGRTTDSISEALTALAAEYLERAASLAVRILPEQEE
jgi:hypothetical protein